MLGLLNDRLQADHTVTITPPLIIRHLRPNELDADFIAILEDLDRFAGTTVA